MLRRFQSSRPQCLVVKVLVWPAPGQRPRTANRHWERDAFRPARAPSLSKRRDLLVDPHVATPFRDRVVSIGPSGRGSPRYRYRGASAGVGWGACSGPGRRASCSVRLVRSGRRRERAAECGGLARVRCPSGLRSISPLPVAPLLLRFEPSAGRFKAALPRRDAAGPRCSRKSGPRSLRGVSPRASRKPASLAPLGPDLEAARPGDGSGQPHRGTAGRGRSSR